MSDKKQSSVEWLVKIYLQTKKIDSFDIEQAKAMHKQEMVNTWTEATAPTHEIGLSDTTYILAQIKKAGQYYNETFNSDEA